MKILIGIPHVFKPERGSEISSKKALKRHSKSKALKKAIFKNLNYLKKNQWVHRYQDFKWVSYEEDGNGHEICIQIHTVENFNLIKDIEKDLTIENDIKLILHNCSDLYDLPLMVTRSLIEQAASDKTIDMIIYLEDDITIEDRELLDKIAYLNTEFGSEYMFMPHRCEYAPNIGDVILSGEPIEKRNDQFWATYEVINSRWLNSTKEFKRVYNPHSGCFFLTSEQVIMANKYWMSKNWIFDFEWVGKLEMACTGIFLPIFKLMKIETKHARYFQVIHNDCLWKDIPQVKH